MIVGALVTTTAPVWVSQSAAWSDGAGVARKPASPTPLLSLRRVPWWLAQTAAQQRLDAQLETIAGASLGSGIGASGCLEVSQGDQVIFDGNGSDMFIPASNLKILTAIAVLDRLGGSTKFVTSVRATGPAGGGVVAGNLYLVGGGDPDLRTSSYGGGTSAPGATFTSLDALALQVREAGISEVTGSVIGDESRFDSQRIVASWKPVYTSEGDVGPLSALDVNDGFVPNPSTTTTKPGQVSGPNGSVAPRPTAGTATGSPTTETSNSAQLAYAAATDPAAQAAQVFTALLRKDGVRVDGGSRTGKTPASARLVTSMDSAPLAAEVDQMLSVSDDTAAELFTKELGYQESGSGTTRAGTAAIRADLVSDGLPVDQLVAVDGSGLDRGDRVSCDLLVQALQHEGPTSTLAKGLPVAGKSGTLSGQMIGTPAEGRVVAKTGTLDNVVSLSGFVLPAPGTPEFPALGQPLVFSLILNGPPDWKANAVADQVAVALARYPVLPPLSDLEPGSVPGP
ncbi:MAG TPA: D-alanyl-D-alanine carboxypeptidase/D-alanyl-D-alanine-endopeptidase [Acidimicrobiales bacterium]|nr:D-alanyl-D-alanine carboxypeptidase/D-alanyl-D-alanine-endopeptidase [Acidimicrobiales bacterium]